MGARSPRLESFGDDFSWSLLDAMPDGALIAAGSGEIVFVNDQVAGMLGYDRDDLLGRSVDDLLPEELRSVHRAHRTRYRAEPTPRPMGAGLLLRARRADGSDFPVEVSLKPLQLGEELFVVAAVRDVSERVASEDEFRRVLHALDASDDGVFIVDAESLRFTYVNEGAVRLVGYDRDELLAMTPLHLNPDSSEAAERRRLASLEASPEDAVVVRAQLLRKDGVEVPVEQTFKLAPVSRDGARLIVSLARDISARLAAQAQLQDSQRALNEAEQTLAIADDRERIARDLHDTVIQRLFGAGLRLEAVAGMVDEPVRDRLEATVQDLDETIKELRMAIFALQGRGTAPGGLRGRLLEVVSDGAATLGVEPRLQFDGPVETISDGIAEQLVPTLREALSNVSQHARASTVRVEIGVTDDVVLRVTDDGVGVPDEVLGGRGLANMAERAQTLGGSFRLRARDGGGTELVWRVPLGFEGAP